MEEYYYTNNAVSIEEGSVLWNIALFWNSWVEILYLPYPVFRNRHHLVFTFASMCQNDDIYVVMYTYIAGFFCAFLKNSRGENSSFFRNSRPKTQGFFQNSRCRRFLTKFSKKLKVSEVLMPIFQSSETRYQRYQLIAILQIEQNWGMIIKKWQILKKLSVFSKKLNEFSKNSMIFWKTQGKNSKLKEKTQATGGFHHMLSRAKRPKKAWL